MAKNKCISCEYEYGGGKICPACGYKHLYGGQKHPLIDRGFNVLEKTALGGIQTTGYTYKKSTVNHNNDK